MFKTKKDIDRHVRTALSKLKSENEKNYRGFTIAKLYYNINEYNCAEHYLVAYLSVKNDCAPAYKLLGQCYQQLKKPLKALTAFQRSLQIDPKQQDLLIEVCNILLSNDIEFNANKAKYWCELAETEKVQHDAVFSLRLKLMKKDTSETKQFKEIILREITSRPNDINLRIRLVKYYIEEKDILDAFKYVFDIEMKLNDNFEDSIEWYNIIWLVLTKYGQEGIEKNWEYWLLLIICLEHLVKLNFPSNLLSQTSNGLTNLSNLLFLFDQNLFQASECILNICPEKELATQFLNHFRGQFLLYASAFLFKKAQLEKKENWHETMTNAFPLLLFAYHLGIADIRESWLKHTGEQVKNLIQYWNRQGAFRCAQAGRTILSCIDEFTQKEISSQVKKLLTDVTNWSRADDILSKIRQFCSNNDWRTIIVRKIFSTNDLNKLNSSHFLNYIEFKEPIFESPTIADLESYEEIAQYTKPQSISHMIYLCLGNDNLNEVNCKYFSGLNFSTNNLGFCGAESLNQLDIDTFLYAATIEAKRSIEIKHEYQKSYTNNYGEPLILPFIIMPNLCSEEHNNWWKAAYQVYKNLAGDNLVELRTILQHGIEAVRGVNGPKIDLYIIFKLGEIFVKRSQLAQKKEKNLIESRAINLYKYALSMLKLKNKSVLEPFRKLFKYKNSQLVSVEQEINKMGEEAITFLAGRYFKNAKYEECIEEFSDIKLPFATFFLAEAYRKLDESNKTPKKTKKLYIDKARDCLNQTLNLLECSNIKSDHPLNSIVQSEIKRMQYTNKLLPENSDDDDDDEDKISTIESTPNHSAKVRRNILTNITNQNTIEIENLVKQMHSTLAFLKEEIITIKPEIANIKKDVNDLKEKFEESLKKKSNSVSREDVTNVLEDLYIIDDELQNQIYPNQQMNISNTSSQQQQQQQQNQHHRMNINNALNFQQQHGVAPVLPYNNQMYSTGYPMNLYQHYLPPPGVHQHVVPSVISSATVQQQRPLLHHPTTFMDPNINYALQNQQINQENRNNLFGFNNQNSNNVEKSVEKLNTSANMWSRLYNNAPVEKSPPINVVITSSDPLPIQTNTSLQPTLSVTIPPQHIKSNILTSELASTNNNFSVTSQTFTNLPNISSTQSFNFACSINKNEDVNALNKSHETTIVESTDDDDNTKYENKDFNCKSDNLKSLLDSDKNEEIILVTTPTKVLRYVAPSWKQCSVSSLEIFKNKINGKLYLKLVNTKKKSINCHLITPDMKLSKIKNEEKKLIWCINESTSTDNKFEKYSLLFDTIITANKFYETFMAAQNEIKFDEKKPAESKKNEFFNLKQSIDSTKNNLTFNKTYETSKKEENQSNLFSFSFKTPNNDEKLNERQVLPFEGFSFGNTTSNNTNNTLSTQFGNVFGGIGEERNAHLNQIKGFEKSNDNYLNISNENKDNDIIEEYTPNVDFKPLIPLPDLIEIQTGEENEKILFEHRAKLLRYDKTSSEWKEKGIGNIKLLVDKNNINKLRLVMRRDSVHKLCCNQRVFKNTKFSKWPKNNCVLSWSGQDYSQNELQTELYTVRFKTTEVCNQFYEALTNAQAKIVEDLEDEAENTKNQDEQNNQKLSLDDSETENCQFNKNQIAKISTDSWKCPKCNSSNKPDNKKCISCKQDKDNDISLLSNKNEIGFGDEFKPVDGSWNCEACYIINKPGTKECIACKTLKKVMIMENEQKSITNIGNNTIDEPKITEGFGDKFKPKPGSWDCNACYGINDSNDLNCIVCFNPRDTTDNTTEKLSNIIDKSNNSKTPFKFGFDKIITTKQTPPAFNFGLSDINNGEFKFGMPKEKFIYENTTKTELNDTVKNVFQNTFKFEPQNEKPIKDICENNDHKNLPKLEKIKFSFELRDKTPEKIKNNSDDDSNGEDVEEENNTHFTPVIPLPDKVEVKTGEENEEVLYTQRAKLYRYVESEWKERGIGDIKILKHKETAKLRVIMRRDQIWKLCLNHVLNESVNYKRKEDKGWLFKVNDYSEGKLEEQTFCIRFKTKDIAENFIDVINTATKNLNSVTELKDEVNTSDTKDKLNISQSDKKLADELQLPYSFYDENIYTKCTGCRGCNADEYVFPDITYRDESLQNDNPLPLSMFETKLTLKDSSLNNENSESNVIKSDVNIENIFSKQLSNLNNVEILEKFNDNTSSIFNKSGNALENKFFFGTGSINNVHPSFGTTPTFGQSFINCSKEEDKTNKIGTGDSLFSNLSNKNIEEGGNLFRQPSFPFKSINNPTKSIFGGNVTNEEINSVTSNKTINCEPTPPNDKTKNLNEEKNNDNDTIIGFNSHPSLSFASLAKTANFESFKTTKNTSEFYGLENTNDFSSFLGDSNTILNKSKELNQSGDRRDDENYDPYYEPIITLPDKIIVSTGEENEDKIFGESCVLYRFDCEKKEWTERGNGEFKILLHRENGKYRILLRREQIHKLVLNQRITADFSIKPMGTNKKAFCWAGMNYAEEPKYERLAVKFKKEEIANVCLKKLEECIENAKKHDLKPEQD